MRTVLLKNASPYADATLNVAPWYLRVCGDQYGESELTKEQILVRDVVETASGIGTRAAMFDYLKSQRSFPMRDMAVTDPRLHHFVRKDLDPEKLCRVGWDMFAHYAASLPLTYVRLLVRDEAKEGDEDKLVSHMLGAMAVFPLKTAFKSYAVMGLYFNQEFDPQLVSAFESSTPVPMAAALSGLARVYVKRPSYELLAAEMMVSSGDAYLDAARAARDDDMMQQSHVREALSRFGMATLFSFHVGEDAHCYSPIILDTLQRYAGYRQSSIALWQSKA